MIKPMTKNILANESVNGPRFNFYNYTVGATYYNNGTIVDFITDGNDLYVCGIEEVTVTAPDIKDQPNLIKLISKGVDGQRGPQGAQGRPGHSPKITAKFDGKQMIIYADGNRIAVTNDLTGPSWKPERQGNTIVWNRTKDDEQPAPIDLNELRAEDYKPVLFRVDSDNTKRSDEESGPANFIQWKYEGDEFWTNLIAIDDLLNIALAGVCTWKSEEDGNWHIGHKEVVKATYDSNKDGKRIISQVELGDVLFDAGPIAKDMQLDIDTLEARLNEIEEILRGINIPSLDGYATEDWVNAQGFLKNVPEVDAYTKAQSDARYQPKGNYLTQHQPLKTINGQSLVGTGDIPISGGQPVDLSGVVKSLTIDGQNKTPDSNGNISFTIGNFNLFNLEARNINDERHLIKIVNGVETDLGIFETGSGEGCSKCWSEEEILALITEEINKIPDVDLSGFYRKAEVDVLIQNLQNQINALIDDDPTIVAISFISTTIYTRTNDITAPSVQTSFAGEHITLDESGDVSETALAEKLESVDSIWTTSPGNGDGYLWVSYARVKIPDGVFTSDWSTPVRLTGVPGRDGSDGGDIEFVYYRNHGEQPGVSNTGRYYNADTQTYSEDTTDASQDDFFPKVVLAGETADDYWKDHPDGIDAQNTHEWVAIRNKKRNGSWGPFSVSLWSRWGEDGVDGDGVQYIYNWSNEFPYTFTGVEDPTSWDTTSTEYQSKYDEYIEGDWVDDPRGVSAEHPFEWVSIRKWRRVNGVYGWQPYSAPALWSTYAESATTRTIITLDINNSQEPVQVTEENKVVKGTDPIFLDTKMFSVLRTDQGELLDWGKIFIGKYTQNGIVFDDDPSVTFDVSRQATITNQSSYDGNITRTIRSAKGNEHRYYEFVIGVGFPENYVLSEPYIIPIKVVDASELFTGIDYLKFNPVYSEKLVTLNYFEQTNVIKKETKEATTYSPSSISILGSVYGDSTFDTVSKFTYSYQFDDNTEVIFNQPVIDKQAVLQAKSANFYFNAQGQEVSSSQNAFATLRIWNSDDNQIEWDEWMTMMEIKLDGSLIEDKVTLGVGYNRVISDRETSYVIYPGKDGIDGQKGDKGDKGDTVQDAYFLTAVYDEGSGNWATWFDNIRNGVPGYSWTPGELGEKWIVNIGTNILTDTPVTLEQPTMTPALKYLWKTSRAVTYNGNTPSYGEWSIPVLASQTGPKGEDGESVVTYEYLNGTIMRVSAWNDGITESTKYWDGETRVLGEGSSEHDGGNEGIKYLDVVSVTSDGKTNWYKCIANHTKRPDNPASDTTYWAEFSIMGDAAFRNLLVENAAYIESLSSKQVVITDNNNIVAGMTSGTITGTELEDKVTPGNIRIWAGATENGNLATAPFTVDNAGAIKADSGKIGDFSISGGLYTNNARFNNDIPESVYLGPEGLNFGGNYRVSKYGNVLNPWQSTGPFGITQGSSGFGSFTLNSNWTAISTTYNEIGDGSEHAYIFTPNGSDFKTRLALYPVIPIPSGGNEDSQIIINLPSVDTSSSSELRKYNGMTLQFCIFGDLRDHRAKHDTLLITGKIQSLVNDQSTTIGITTCGKVGLLQFEFIGNRWALMDQYFDEDKFTWLSE